MHKTVAMTATNYFHQDDVRSEAKIIKDQVIVSEDNSEKRVLGSMESIILFPPLHWISNSL